METTANLQEIMDQVSRDKGVSKTILIEALEAAMLTAARRVYGMDKDLEAHLDPDTGDIEIFEFSTVVEQVENHATEIDLSSARELDPEAQVGDSIGQKLGAEDLGRVAAQTAKQVIIQRVREAERENVHSEYADRQGELVTGVVRRFERGSLIVDLGRAEAVLPLREQCPRESYRANDRIQAYVVDVNKQARGAQIVLSRTSPGLLIKLFEMEVPEIYEGIVRIEAAAREPGARSKIAVASTDRDVDPVGACVGMKGSRVQAVVQELRGEKVDIVPWHEDTAQFVCNALAPAEVSRVLMDDANHAMEIIVPDDQLSLAIGRRGQNVRLASQLSGWRLDIVSESKVKEIKERAFKSLGRLTGVSELHMQTLYNYAIRCAQDVLEADDKFLADIPGIGADFATRLKNDAGRVVTEEAEERVVLKAQEEAEARRQAQVMFDAERRRLDGPTEAGRMLRVRGVGEKTAAALEQAEIHLVEQLAGLDALDPVVERSGLEKDLLDQLVHAAKCAIERESQGESSEISSDDAGSEPGYAPSELLTGPPQVTEESSDA